MPYFTEEAHDDQVYGALRFATSHPDLSIEAVIEFLNALDMVVIAAH
jgi:hypothetical protein